MMGVQTTGPGLTSTRLRLKLAATVHPRTIDALDRLAVKLGTNRGRLIDRMTTVLVACYDDGKVRCVHGQVCSIGRTDMPDTF